LLASVRMQARFQRGEREDNFEKKITIDNIDENAV
jgi:hypothetical protein